VVELLFTANQGSVFGYREERGKVIPTLAPLGISSSYANAADTIIRNERQLGYRENFLRAISLCEGEVIALCDQDDVWMNAF
jgi:hypothetical protein